MYRHLLALILAAPLAASAAPEYKLSPITAPAATLEVSGLNNLGQIVGTAKLDSGLEMPVLITDGIMRPVGGTASNQLLGYRGLAVNDAGIVVAGTWTAAAVVDGNSIIPIAEAGARLSVGGINNQGQIAGNRTADAAPHGWGHAFIDGPNSSAVMLNDRGFNASYANDINESGTLVGTVDYGCNCFGGQHGFVYRNGQLTELGTLGGRSSEAIAVNDHNVAVGNAQLAGNLHRHAAMFADGTVIDLGLLAGAEDSFAFDINNSGEIVGAVNGGGTSSAFLFRGGAMVDLNTLVDPALGWHLDYAGAINEQHQILALGTDRNGLRGAVLLTLDRVSPVPEPATYAALLAGLALLGTMRRVKRD